MNACGVPPMVTVMLGIRVSPAASVPPHGTMGNALVSKLPGCVCVRIAEPPAGIMKLPHRLNCAVGRCRSIDTLSMVSGVAPLLSMRMAPAFIGVPLPTKTTLGEPCQGVGKLRVEDELSAYPTETLMLEACIIIAAAACVRERGRFAPAWTRVGVAVRLGGGAGDGAGAGGGAGAAVTGANPEPAELSSR